MLNSLWSVSNAGIQGRFFPPSYPTPSMPGSTRCHQHPVSDQMLYFTCQTSRREFLHLFALPTKKEKKRSPALISNEPVCYRPNSCAASTNMLSFFANTPSALRTKLLLDIELPWPSSTLAPGSRESHRGCSHHAGPADCP